MVYQCYYCNCDGSHPCEFPPGIAMCEVGVGGQKTVVVCPRCGKSVYCEPMPSRQSAYFPTFDHFYAQYPGCPVESHRDAPAEPISVVAGRAHG